MQFSAAFAVACFVCCTVATGSPLSVQTLEPPLPAHWTSALSSLHASKNISFSVSIARPAEGLETIRQHALRASTPSDALYGQYLTAAEVDALSAPSPAAVATVQTWVSNHGCQVAMKRHLARVSCEVSKAEGLLGTAFYTIENQETGQTVSRAGAYSLPHSVQAVTAAVYGLHGFPLPPKTQQSTATKAEAGLPITPAILKETYSITVDGGSRNKLNRQAVAEFHDQMMNETDLAGFFEKYMPNEDAEDAKVYHFEGDAGEGKDGKEAALDIQYIMGVAPKVLTEFWYNKNSMFCEDMKIWAQSILDDDNPPLVHSISYGAQANLTFINGCTDQEVLDTDNDFVSLAARGITLVFSSGDDGSGYVPNDGDCATEENVQWEGTLLSSSPLPLASCCNAGTGFAGWTFTGDLTTPCVPDSISVHTQLEGTVERTINGANVPQCCALAAHVGVGWDFIKGLCTIYSEVTGNVTKEGVKAAMNPPTPKCDIYKTVTGSAAAEGTYSGGHGVAPPSTPELWPAWPASSPWVTAVGATRFIDQDSSQPQMAVDTFGSGGGFSQMLPVFDEQAAATAHYLDIAPDLPPTGSFPPKGRGTPDVSALGMGYQILVNGEWDSIGGTSASAPAFAGMISLLNEERLNAGMPAMGYLNPFLYANPQMFTDVTEGTNALGPKGIGPVAYGFACTEGWDPATGLGTPIFSEMLKAALAGGTN